MGVFESYRYRALWPLLVFFCAGLGACASTPSEQPVAGAFSDQPWHLQTIDGQAVDIVAQVQTQSATVLVFWSTSCPCVRRYQKRVEALERIYESQGAAFFAVISGADESLETVRQVVAERQVKTHLLVDRHAHLADFVGAKSTPTVVILDREGNIRYRGWLDNEREPGEPGRIPYAENALKAVLAGKGEFQKRSPAYGCRITKALGAERMCMSSHDK